MPSAASDSFCGAEESASASAGSCSSEPSDVYSLSLLVMGRGMERLLQIFTCGLPCNLLRAASLHVIGSLGCSEYDAVLAWLSREPRVLLGSMGESHCMGGLSAFNSSSVTDGVSADQGAKGVQVFSVLTLALGMGVRVDRCRRRSSTLGQVVTACVLGHRMRQGGFEVGPGNGLERHDYRGLGLEFVLLWAWVLKHTDVNENLGMVLKYIVVNEIWGLEVVGQCVLVMDVPWFFCTSCLEPLQCNCMAW